jgi:hypothetical protein
MRGLTAILVMAVIAVAQGTAIRIEVLEGQGAINNITRKTAWEPAVQVLDEAGAPVAGATVTFVLPAVGASGQFADGSRVLAMQTDENGRAVASGLRPNNVVGQFEIRVTATHSGATANVTITQTNAAPAEAPSGKSKRYLILGLVGAGIAGGVLAAVAGGGGSSNGGSSPPPANPGTVTPGTPGFGPPQ